MASCGTVEVLPQFSSGNVTITNCSLSRTNTTVGGEPVVASATVENGNNTQAEVEVAFESGGQTVTETATVGGQSTVTITGSFVYESQGSYDISVSLTRAGRA
jgi:hypothetical protein